MTRKAIVTGGARPDGIGWATALAMADAGYEVVVTGVSDQEVSGAASHAGVSAKVLIQQLKELEAVLRPISRRPRLAVEYRPPTKQATFKRPSQSFHQRPQSGR